ncbi:MAG: hypothetical protein ABIP17_16525 [Ilumatobacteraceae bacterium]
MPKVAEASTDDDESLLRRTPLVAAAILSVAIVVVALTVVVAAAFVIGAVGLTLTARPTTRSGAARAASLVSIAFGLAVGPAVYVVLALAA